MHNIQSPQAPHDKQAQTKAKHVKRTSEKKHSPYYFDIHDHDLLTLL